MSKSEPPKSVELFNGEPEILVRKSPTGTYYFATSKFANFNLGSETSVENFMKRYGYKYKIVKASREVDDLL